MFEDRSIIHQTNGNQANEARHEAIIKYHSKNYTVYYYDLHKTELRMNKTSVDSNYLSI